MEIPLAPARAAYSRRTFSISARGAYKTQHRSRTRTRLFTPAILNILSLRTLYYAACICANRNRMIWIRAHASAPTIRAIVNFLFKLNCSLKTTADRSYCVAFVVAWRIDRCLLESIFQLSQSSSPRTCNSWSDRVLLLVIYPALRRLFLLHWVMEMALPLSR